MFRIFEVADWLQAFRICYLEIFQFKVCVTGHLCFDKSLHLIKCVCGGEGFGLLEGVVYEGRFLPFVGMKQGVAGTERQTVRGAYNLHRHDLDGVVFQCHQPLDDGHLLVVLFPKIGTVGLNHFKQAAHHHRHPLEVSGAGGTLHHFFQIPKIVGFLRSFRIHLFHSGDECDVADAADRFRILFGLSWVAFQVVGVVKLGGIDKNAADHRFVFLPGLTHQGQVPLVQRTHGGDEAD